MAISFNTSASANSASSQTLTQAITVPAGVLAGDVVLVLAQQVPLTGTPSTFTISSTGTTPATAPGTNNPQTGTEGIASVTAQVWYFVASGTDAGKIITVTAAAVGFWAVALAAYTGVSNSAPIDVLKGAFGGASTASVTLPVVPTVTANDWAVFAGGGAAEGGNLTGPAGQTSRVSIVSSADIAAAFYDSNASVGAGGTNIGGGTFTTSTATNSLLIGFTIGLTPAAAATVTAVPVQLPGRFRRSGVRAFWRGKDVPFPALGTAAVSGFITRRRAVRGQHQSVSGSLAIRTQTGGFFRQRVHSRAVWHGTGAVPGVTPVPAAGGFTQRRKAVRAAWHSVAGPANAIPAVAHPPVTGGVAVRRPFIPRVPCWRGVTPFTVNAIPPRGTVPPLIAVTPRRHVPGFWRGVTPVSSNALPTGALAITLAQARLLWVTGPVGLNWTAVEARVLWMSGPVSVS